MDDVVGRLKSRLPVVPRSSRDNMVAAHEDLQREYDALRAEAERGVEAHEDLQREYDALRAEAGRAMSMLSDPEVEPFLTFAPPGHFYSPIPPLSDAMEYVNERFHRPSELPGIDLRLEAQLDLAAELTSYQQQYDSPVAPAESHRYSSDNPSYGRGDALALESMLRSLRPRQIIEIGSGHSSALMLDTIDRYFDHPVSLTFIEPFADLLREQFRAGDAERCKIVEEPLQAVDSSRFEQLEAGDLLFIDSTHVVRPGSDVLREVLDILPRLAPGVNVHIHDMFFPFEYPPFWVEEGRLWGEAYLVRAFLTHNGQYQVVFWPDYIECAAPDRFGELLPRMVGEGFGALWLRRVD